LKYMVMMIPRKRQISGIPLPSHRPKAGHALSLEDLDGVGFELIVPGKAFVEAHHTLRFLVGHGADQLQCQLSFQQTKNTPPATLWTCLPAS
jgi:hypothetical protein